MSYLSHNFIKNTFQSIIAILQVRIHNICSILCSLSVYFWKKPTVDVIIHNIYKKFKITKELSEKRTRNKLIAALNYATQLQLSLYPQIQKSKQKPHSSLRKLADKYPYGPQDCT